ncbi:MAG TPA: TIGR02221 family CRISPR-associated protein [Burkholderiaceae bacterium]|jgi:CRISPR-associated Csx2 family protein|nr:TIGR02221 family CRISPR-associated protein [Burkholderiaceae bacterium]
MTTLISLLGKSQLDSRQGYRTARYRFPDGSERETAYFGLALAEHLAAQRLVLLGTASSMWDMLVENVVGDAAQEELRIELIDAVRRQEVDESLLQRLTPAFERRLGRPVRALVIPHSTGFVEQQRLLARLAEELDHRERIVLDVTHGFRHLAMLGLTAARYLSHAREVALQGLYYGALDMSTDGVAPVIELSGLAHVQEWAEALAAYEASGDFSRFAPLLARDGLAATHVEALARGWHFVSVNNIADAARTLQPVYQALGQPLAGASELFRERLRRALRWVAANDLSERQRVLALQALQRGDALRASLWGYESFLSREVEAAGGNPLDHRAKEEAEAKYRLELREGEHADWKRAAFWLLKNVRNALAHGTRPAYAPHAQLLQNPERLRERLEQTLNRLTNTP